MKDIKVSIICTMILVFVSMVIDFIQSEDNIIEFLPTTACMCMIEILMVKSLIALKKMK